MPMNRSFVLLAAFFACAWAKNCTHDHDEDDLDFTESQRLALRVIPGIGATFSIFGAGFIIFTYFYIGTALQRGHYKLIAWMSVADGMSAFSYLLGLATVGGTQDCETSTICFIQAMLSQFFEVASMFWVLCIAMKVSWIIYTFLYPATMKAWGETISRWDKNCLQKLCMFIPDSDMRLFHLVSWGIPGILCMIAMAGNTFGDAGPWCWIEKEHQWARMLLYYVWLLLIMIFDTTMFTFVIWHAKSVRSSDGEPLMAAEPLTYRLRLYMVAFIITKFFSIINRFYDLAHPNDPSFTLNMLQSLFEPFTGFCNAMVYGANRMVYLLYKEKFKRGANARRSMASASDAVVLEPKSTLAYTKKRSALLMKHDSLKVISDDTDAEAGTAMHHSVVLSDNGDADAAQDATTTSATTTSQASALATGDTHTARAGGVTGPEPKRPSLQRFESLKLPAYSEQ